ncbi:hypothetical protein GCM10010518_02840 [Kitasatospora cinereorecta]
MVEGAGDGRIAAASDLRGREDRGTEFLRHRNATALEALPGRIPVGLVAEVEGPAAGQGPRQCVGEDALRRAADQVGSGERFSSVMTAVSPALTVRSLTGSAINPGRRPQPRGGPRSALATELFERAASGSPYHDDRRALA